MKKFVLTTCKGITKEFKYLEDLIKILGTDPISELTNHEICFLDAGMDIQRKNKNGEFLYKVNVVA